MCKPSICGMLSLPQRTLLLDPVCFCSNVNIYPLLTNQWQIFHGINRDGEEMSLVQNMPRAWKGACMLVLQEEVWATASMFSLSA